MSELKPCPFCGGIAVLCCGGNYFVIRCSNCDARGRKRPEEKEAIEAWNRRMNNDTERTIG